MEENVASPEEVKQLRALEELLRGFKEHFESQTAAAVRRGSAHHPFAPQTVRLVEETEPILKRLEELRPLDQRAA